MSYQVIKLRGSRKIGKVHYSGMNEVTLCGKELDSSWYILTTNGESDKVDCKECVERSHGKNANC